MCRHPSKPLSQMMHRQVEALFRSLVLGQLRQAEACLRSLV
ncbi:hypothetical protein HMPREF9104_00783 [Lentilactobacillus kisonensis F0435]|uniref:Uncharacterized protein n=1 Tax=Lentilactobacillus kisonensis F0435 TaxID=797516 RepID=H1LDV8_9LACO|nr:hypothetical protein HMPREF9104_00783 [Lentilactobacillus kisonensis F0435]